jgi:uncharacterized membrane-anchored protein
MRRPTGGRRIVPTLPADHPLRAELTAEVHARPPELLPVPQRVSYLGMFADGTHRAAEWAHLAALAARYGVTLPGKPVNHFSRDFGAFRLKYERHTEFARYVFIVAGSDPEPFATTAIDRVPAEWIAALPGSLMIASHAVLLASEGDDRRPNWDALSARVFDGNPLVGSDVGEGIATVVTDVRVRPDGFSRVLVLDRGLSPRQAGRMLQRLFEIDTYRIMALLALPLARDVLPFLLKCEQELSQLTAALTTASERDEPQLFEQLTRLEAAVENAITASDYRFGAAMAYYELVQRRIDELRELRIQGLQTFQEFTERRLAPAMNTCRTAVARQESLSARVARANQLLSTRVGISRERQNQTLLESMDRRAEAQLRLQQTVEGLSVAAITYYVVGLVGYLAKSLNHAGVPVDPEVAMGIAIPIVAGCVWYLTRRIRRRLATSRRPDTAPLP